MTSVELVALSLGLSIVVAALALALGSALERLLRDPGVRESAWAAALYLSALPPVLVGLLLLVPPPVAEAGASPELASVETSALIQVVAEQSALDLSRVASAFVGLAALVAAGRAFNLARLCLQLQGLVRATVDPSAALVETVQASAMAIDVPRPPVRVSAVPGAEAMVVGLRSPVLIIPEAMASRPADPAIMAVCAHELAHLKRGDHRALWAEEVLLTLLAANPLLAVLRSRRAAAREEACDAMALAHAPAGSRRRYARLLVDALRSSVSSAHVPALTFTSAKRTSAMLRLKAILDPASAARPRDRWAVAGLGALIAAASLGGSIAVASERAAAPAPDVASAPQPEPASQPEVAPVASPRASSRPAPVPPAASARLAPAPAPVSAPAPEARPSPLSEAAPTAQAAVITNVTWAQHPAPIFPSEAARNGVDQGSVTLTCAPQSDGRLSACSIVVEDPAGQGFGAAALGAVRTARVSPDMMRGAAPGSTIRFTIRFRVAD
jgi:TonB family protein